MERQTDQWDLVIKVKHGDTLRRIGAYVHGQLMDLNMSKLRSKIISLFRISHDTDIILTYTDEDGDIVTLDDDDELRDAVIGQRLNPLRINVQLKSPDSSDARPEPSSPSSLVNAPRPVTIPTVVEQENTIPEPLLGVVSNLVGIAQKTLSSSPAFAQKVDNVMNSEPFRSTIESLSKDVKKATAFSPALAQVAEQLSNLVLSNAGQTSGPSCESSGVPRGASTHQMDLNVSEEPKDSNVPILEDIELPSDMTRSVNQIPNENGSGNGVVQGAGVMTPSGDCNVDATKKGKASLYPIDDLLASICTTNNFPEGEGCNTNLDGKSGLATATASPPANQALHGSGNYRRPMQLLPINMDGSACIMDGSSSSKHPSMKADLSSLSQTGFNSQSRVPIMGPFGSIWYDGTSLMSEGTKTQCRRPLISDRSMPRSFHRGVHCDGCGMHPIVGPRFKSNVKEDYDLCNICFSQMGNEADYTRIDHAHPRGARKLMGFRNHHARICHQLHGRAVRLQRAKLESRFIRDVTVLDGTVMRPSTHFTKIWRLLNNGDVPWPFGTQLVWVGGDQFGDRVSAHLEIPQMGVPVDEELDIAVDFTAPSRPGRYISYWRMAAPSGQKFGQRVWVLIQVGYSPPNSAAGSSFHPDLNLNLPPESSRQDGSVIIDANAVPLDSGIWETNFSGTNEGWVERAVEDVSGGHVEQPAQVAGGLMDASNDAMSQPTPVAAAPYPLIDPQGPPSDTATAGDGNNQVEQTLLRELEEMGFKQIELNKEILRLNEYDLEQSVDDLCGYAEWDPLLSELKEIGFNDKELNKKLLIKNGGSIKRTVLDLIARKASE